MKFRIIILLFFACANIQSLFAAAEPVKEVKETQEQYDQAAINFLRNHDVTVLLEGSIVNLHRLKNQNISLYTNIYKVIDSLKEIIIKRNYDKFDHLLKLFIDVKTKKLKSPSLFEFYLIDNLVEPTLFDERLIKIFLKNGGDIDHLIFEANRQIVDLEIMLIEGGIHTLRRNLKILKLMKQGSFNTARSSH